MFRISTRKDGKLWRCTFTVQGQFAFPIDMLRYDSCYPDSQQDVTAIIESGDPVDRATRQVTLVRIGETRKEAERITRQRWESFGWGLVDD